MLKTLKLEVVGTTRPRHNVHFWLTPTGEFRSSCTCEAGYQVTHCKHRMDILAGDYTALTQPLSDEDKEFLREAVETTESGRIIREVLAIRAEVDDAKARLRLAFAALDKEFCRVHFFDGKNGGF